MPHTPQHQFDPVAASAIAAINSTQRLGRTVRSQAGLPQPPGAEMAFTQGRSLLQQASGFSPLNILGTGQGPNLPGMQGQGGLPSPQQLLPGGQGMQGQGGLPSPQQLLPGAQGQSPFPPLPGMQQQTAPTGRRTRSGTPGSGGGSGGGAATEEDTNPDRKSEDSRT